MSYREAEKIFDLSYKPQKVLSLEAFPTDRQMDQENYVLDAYYYKKSSPKFFCRPIYIAALKTTFPL